ncbi:PDZ domain-containing protein [Salicibibacter cibarius]|uniref:PDZ domain-containing protein n=1 Tax=Salicibibacter cibarius TaxID=2743000 RepID=A0A7T6Z6V5_9BACI|nr:PDZ domain-containing protein [Salicibibacter cibarius]QQK77886.1 PDZ domain-containing protein [Salicibibacter cibarius]
MDHWFIDLVIGIGSFFIHPLTYIGLLAMIGIGYRRLKRERKMFHMSTGSVGKDVFHRLLPGVLAGVVLSVVALASGIVLTPEFLLTTTATYLVLIIVGGAGFASPAYALGLALLLSYFLPFGGGTSVDPLPVLIIIGSLLFIEGVFMRLQSKREQFSPLRLRSKRGKWVGGQRLDRMWLIPVCIFIPGETFVAGDWWPLLPVTDDVSMLLVPFLVGFRLTTLGQRMKIKIKSAGTRMIGFGALLFVGAALVMYLPGWVWLPVVLIAIIGRMLLQFYEYVSDRRKDYYFVPKNDGIVILSVLPESPGEKMGLLPGEIVTKVHGNPIHTEWNFYQQLQINPAYGRIEVIDANGERRVEKAALYDNQHHELGLLFLHPNEESWEDE